MLDEVEITCIFIDANGIISHCGVKGYGIQDILTIEKLIRDEACSFFVNEGGKKRNVYVITASNNTALLTTDPSGTDTNGLDSLPPCDRPMIRYLIESIR